MKSELLRKILATIVTISVCADACGSNCQLQPATETHQVMGLLRGHSPRAIREALQADKGKSAPRENQSNEWGAVSIEYARILHEMEYIKERKEGLVLFNGEMLCKRDRIPSSEMAKLSQRICKLRERIAALSSMEYDCGEGKTQITLRIDGEGNELYFQRWKSKFCGKYIARMSWDDDLGLIIKLRQGDETLVWKATKLVEYDEKGKKQKLPVTYVDADSDGNDTLRDDRMKTIIRLWDYASRNGFSIPAESSLFREVVFNGFHSEGPYITISMGDNKMLVTTGIEDKEKDNEDVYSVSFVPYHDEKTGRNMLLLLSTNNRTGAYCLSDPFWYFVRDRNGGTSKTATDHIIEGKSKFVLGSADVMKEVRRRLTERDMEYHASECLKEIVKDNPDNTKINDTIARFNALGCTGKPTGEARVVRMSVLRAMGKGFPLLHFNGVIPNEYQKSEYEYRVSFGYSRTKGLVVCFDFADINIRTVYTIEQYAELFKDAVRRKTVKEEGTGPGKTIPTAAQGRIVVSMDAELKGIIERMIDADDTAKRSTESEIKLEKGLRQMRQRKGELEELMSRVASIEERAIKDEIDLVNTLKTWRTALSMKDELGFTNETALYELLDRGYLDGRPVLDGTFVEIPVKDEKGGTYKCYYFHPAKTKAAYETFKSTGDRYQVGARTRLIAGIDAMDDDGRSRLLAYVNEKKGSFGESPIEMSGLKDELKKWLKAEDVYKALGVKRSWLKNKVACGYIKAYVHISEYDYYHPKIIDAFKEEVLAWCKDERLTKKQKKLGLSVFDMAKKCGLIPGGILRESLTCDIAMYVYNTVIGEWMHLGEFAKGHQHKNIGKVRRDIEQGALDAICVRVWDALGTYFVSKDATVRALPKKIVVRKTKPKSLKEKKEVPVAIRINRSAAREQARAAEAAEKAEKLKLAREAMEKKLADKAAEKEEKQRLIKEKQERILAERKVRKAEAHRMAMVAKEKASSEKREAQRLKKAAREERIAKLTKEKDIKKNEDKERRKRNAEEKKKKLVEGKAELAKSVRDEVLAIADRVVGVESLGELCIVRRDINIAIRRIEQVLTGKSINEDTMSETWERVDGYLVEAKGIASDVEIKISRVSADIINGFKVGEYWSIDIDGRGKKIWKVIEVQGDVKFECPDRQKSLSAEALQRKLPEAEKVDGGKRLESLAMYSAGLKSARAKIERDEILRIAGTVEGKENLRELSSAIAAIKTAIAKIEKAYRKVADLVSTHEDYVGIEECLIEARAISVGIEKRRNDIIKVLIDRFIKDDEWSIDVDDTRAKIWKVNRKGPDWVEFSRRGTYRKVGVEDLQRKLTAGAKKITDARSLASIDIQYEQYVPRGDRADVRKVSTEVLPAEYELGEVTAGDWVIFKEGGLRDLGIGRVLSKNGGMITIQFIRNAKGTKTFLLSAIEANIGRLMDKDKPDVDSLPSSIKTAIGRGGSLKDIGCPLNTDRILAAKGKETEWRKAANVSGLEKYTELGIGGSL